MASEADTGERSEDATQQRREDFRNRGQVAQSKDSPRLVSWMHEPVGGLQGPLSAIALVVVNLLAIWPARRAARGMPASALRSE